MVNPGETKGNRGGALPCMIIPRMEVQGVGGRKLCKDVDTKPAWNPWLKKQPTAKGHMQTGDHLCWRAARRRPAQHEDRDGGPHDEGAEWGDWVSGGRWGGDSDMQRGRGREWHATHAA